MGFFDVFTDAWDGIKDAATSVYDGVKTAAVATYDSVLKPVYNGIIKPVGEKAINFGMGAIDRVQRIEGAGDKLIDATGNAVEGIGSFLGGNSNILLYIGLGLVGVLVVPKLIDKVL